ncbi:zinc-dependent alcohol dehydrogenase [Amaricoccus solimangrovi]|uniref:Zinc-binding alcohol dehydrogenase n=1 Tax=Amaricoccus solimangrovi TaxID=2589815 RepID=A0A501WYA0_9RHOB|nr:zinc-binding alcohol dehydrogenase [Amaricoccus solimangrovi]TPE53204.1 zinc-binding alcohol dehydrogenase [Amaricoccus solimangrovi]
MPRALWITAPGVAELRETAAGTGEIRARALFGGVSRGTEALVFRGGVPEGERGRMRAPLQEGDFPFPVKYGYATVARVTEGPAALRGRVIFALAPHQDEFALPAAMAAPVPDAVPPARAVLAANMETALNVVWDAGAGPGDRVAVIGAGVVGALAAWLCARMPGAEVTLVDVNPARAGLAAALGCRFAAPEAAPGGCDLAIHASASAAGLATAIGAVGVEGTVVEASWYGDRAVEIGLGGAFHAGRVRIVSSQVGSVAPSRRPRWSHARRLAKALDLLADPVLDALISGETDFADLAARYGAILGDPGTLCHRVRYRAEGGS